MRDRDNEQKVDSNILLDLHDSHITQYTTDKGKSAWLVRKNGNNEELATLPGEMTESQIFAVMNMAREFELAAFNTGIAFGKQKAIESVEEYIRKLEDNIKHATAENDRIAGVLDNHIKSEE